jgi:hypothetical protein
MGPELLAIGLAGVIVASLMAKPPKPASGSASREITPFDCVAGKEFSKAKRAEVRKIVKATAKEIGSLYDMQGLDTFLDAVGNSESQYNPCAAGDGGVSKGIFQIRATTAFSTYYTHLRDFWPEMAKDPVLSTIVAAYCVSRALKQADEPTWLAVRRWWKYPSLVDDSNNADPISQGIRERFAKALNRIGVSPSFMDKKVSSKNWPTFPIVLRKFGYDNLATLAEGVSSGQAEL